MCWTWGTSLLNRITSVGVETDENTTAPLSPGATDAKVHGTAGWSEKAVPVAPTPQRKVKSRIIGLIVFKQGRPWVRPPPLLREPQAGSQRKSSDTTLPSGRWRASGRHHSPRTTQIHGHSDPRPLRFSQAVNATTNIFTRCVCKMKRTLGWVGFR